MAVDSEWSARYFRPYFNILCTIFHACPPIESCSASEGDSVRLHNEVIILGCIQERWYYLCAGGVAWTPALATVVCRELGHSDQGKRMTHTNTNKIIRYTNQQEQP